MSASLIPFTAAPVLVKTVYSLAAVSLAYSDIQRAFLVLQEQAQLAKTVSEQARCSQLLEDSAVHALAALEHVVSRVHQVRAAES